VVGARGTGSRVGQKYIAGGGGVKRFLDLRGFGRTQSAGDAGTLAVTVTSEVGSAVPRRVVQGPATCDRSALKAWGDW
jgi:hypothetical protein